MDVTSRMRHLRGPVALVATGALALAACSSGGGGGSGDSADSLVVWFPGTNQTEIDLVTDVIVPQFEEETGVEVEVTFADWGDLSTKLSAAFAAGTAPDVFGHGPAAIADYAVNERVEPLDGYVAQLDPDDVEDLSSALPGGQVDGVQYLIPLSMQGNMFIYDAEMFADAGLDPDAPPSTWEEIYEAAEALTVRDASGTVTRSGLLLPTHPVGTQQSFANLLLAAGGDQLSPDGTQAAFNSPEGEQALRLLVDMYSGEEPVATGLGANFMDAAAAQQPIVTGDAAIMMTVAPRATDIMAAAPDRDFRILPVPRFESADSGHALGGAGAGLMISSDSPDKDLAWQFIEYMIDPGTSEQYTEGIGAVPTRMSAVQGEYAQSSPVVQAWLEALPQFTANPNVPGWVQARDTMATYLEGALRGQATPEDTLTEMETAVNDVLAAARP
ncbi:ABC transporter substrate-binding protein [Promicromonospora iranensis]|uniref:Multiple sugar transport system substrate-binding protein n=1 Tax=Promicromonospora iranensis TaxID=1105144 RepID=A0ABU2CLV8_9MICO|nr:ABC transporter substrate-binding protein [Promicromonospora iranensis]MDR7382332.1 multiple sugar transport system substrate-binding protein [Promicromonospora iranensis]